MTVMVHSRPTESCEPANGWMRQAAAHLAYAIPVVASVSGVAPQEYQGEASVGTAAIIGTTGRFETIGAGPQHLNFLAIGYRSPDLSVDRPVDQALRGALMRSTELVELL